MRRWRNLREANYYVPTWEHQARRSRLTGKCVLEALLVKRTICLTMIACLFSCGSWAKDAPTDCGPFGAPSAEVISDVKPSCGAGKLLGPWKDADHIDRYACLFQPTSTAANSKLPMIGVGWDNWYRQLNPAGDVKIGDTTWRENADAATIDHFIADEVATGKVDTNRIYLSGWSNGAAMGFLYAVNRSNIAAAAVYSAPNPFGAFEDPCPQQPVASVPTSNKQIQIFDPAARIMHVHNACDVGGICPNGEQLATELNAAGVFVDDVILDNRHQPVHACDDSAQGMDDRDAGFFQAASAEECAVG